MDKHRLFCTFLDLIDYLKWVGLVSYPVEAIKLGNRVSWPRCSFTNSAKQMSHRTTQSTIVSSGVLTLGDFSNYITMLLEVGVDEAYSELQPKVQGFGWCKVESKIGVKVAPEEVVLVTCILGILNLHSADHLVTDPCVKIGFDLIEVSICCGNQLVFSNQQCFIVDMSTMSLDELCVQRYGHTCEQCWNWSLWRDGSWSLQ